MDIGVTIFGTDRTMGIAELARAAEERGFASLYLPEHTHIPVSRLTPAATGVEELPDSYARTLDPWIALATAGAVTTTLRLGTGVALVAQHDPIALAKQIATLEHLCPGRITLGVGFGWNAEEMADHGIAFAQRREVVAEHVAAMRALWTHDVAGFEGEHVRFSPSWQWPKPSRLPVLIGGGDGPKLLGAVAAWADGWMPIGGAGLGAALPRLRALTQEAGRDPDALLVVPFGVEPTPGKLAHYEGLGIDEVVLRLPEGDRDEVLAVLDAFTAYL